MQLYSYFRSSASFRVRIALALKGLDRTTTCRCTSSENEQLAPAFDARRAGAAGAAARRDGDAVADASRSRSSNTSTRRIPSRRCCRPTRSAAPACARSRSTSPARSIRSNNLRVLRYLRARAEGRRGRQEPLVPALGRDRARGGRARSSPAAAATGRYCHGDTPTLADCVLVPQIFNARRVDCRLDHVPTVMRVFDACMRARRVRVRRSPRPAPTRRERARRRLAARPTGAAPASAR